MHGDSIDKHCIRMQGRLSGARSALAPLNFCYKNLYIDYNFHITDKIK